jgi:hypothetical protein
LKICKNCSSVFVSEGSIYCPVCIEKKKDLLEDIRGYILTNPTSNPSKIAEKVGVSEDEVSFFIKDGKIVLSDEVWGECEICKSPTLKGKICLRCKSRFKMKTGRVTSNLPPKDVSNPDGTGLEIRDLFKKGRM